MIVILDLDYTLLDTGAFKEVLVDELAALDVPREEVLKSYTDLADRQGPAYGYDPDLQLELLEKWLDGPRAAQAAQRLEAAARGAARFLYPGTAEFLNGLKGAGARLVLLTLGNRAWQRLKVEGAGLEGFFDRVEVTERPKTEVLAGLAGEDDKVFVVNDNAAELRAMREAVPDFRYIAKLGPTPPPAGFDLPVCRTYDEITELILS